MGIHQVATQHDFDGLRWIVVITQTTDKQKPPLRAVLKIPVLLDYGLQLAGRYLASKVPPVQVQVTSPFAVSVGVMMIVPPPAAAV